MQINPLSDRVVVQIIEADQVSKSGIIIPDVAKEKPVIGEVIAVGPGKVSDFSGEIIPMRIQVGNKILYGRYSGTEFEHDDKKYLVMKESDVLAILN